MSASSTAAEGSTTSSVVIADEQPTTRASIQRLLERHGFEVAGEAADADTALEMALRKRPDVCVLDVLLPGDGIDLIGRLVAALPATAVIVLTASRDRDLFFDAIRAGAVGYLLKDIAPERLPHAIRGVLGGEAAIPRTLVASLVSELRSRGRRQLVVGRAGRAELTAREWDVAELLVDGLSTTQIAARLGISPVTVRRHISAILERLGVSDRAAAVGLLAGEGGSAEIGRRSDA